MVPTTIGNNLSTDKPKAKSAAGTATASVKMSGKSNAFETLRDTKITSGSFGNTEIGSFGTPVPPTEDELDVAADAYEKLLEKLDEVDPALVALEKEYEAFSSFADNGKYDWQSCDFRGVPTLLHDGTLLSKQQVKKVEKSFKFWKKKARAAKAARTTAAVPRLESPHLLPEGYWSGYPASAVSIKEGAGSKRLGIDVGGVISLARLVSKRNAAAAAAAAAAGAGSGSGTDAAGAGAGSSVDAGAQPASSTALDPPALTAVVEEDTVISDQDDISVECFEAIGKLVEHFGPQHTFIVSKASANMVRRTRLWLKKQLFYEKTGLLPDNVYFCTERPQKAEIVDALGISHFIDDRWSVLEHLTECTARYLFPNHRDHSVPKVLLRKESNVFKVSGWADVLANLHLEGS